MSELYGKSAHMIVVDELYKMEIGKIDGFRIIIDKEAKPAIDPQDYESPADQALYRNIRNQGFSKKEAEELLKLMGIEPKVVSWHEVWADAYDQLDLNSRREPKKKLPFYFNKRRF